MVVCTAPEGGDWVNVSVAHPGDATGHEVPDGYPAVVAADRQQSPASVEGAREGLAARVQYAIVVLRAAGGRRERWKALHMRDNSN